MTMTLISAADLAARLEDAELRIFDVRHVSMSAMI